MQLSGCIAVRTPGDLDSAYDERVRSLRERLLTSPFIENVSFSSSIPGKQITTSGGVQRVVGPELDGNNVFFIEVNEDFLKTYNIRLIAGKDFSETRARVPSIILNEAALKTLKFDSPEEALKHRVHWQRKEFEVIGVFANYNHLFLKETFEPMMLSYNPSPAGFMTVKIREGSYEQGIAAAKDELQRLFPSAPFEYSFLETAYNYQYHSIQQFEASTNYFAVLAVVIASMGLLALSYYHAQARSREVAIRKVFGAGVIDVLALLSGKYIRIVILSCLVGSAITFFIMRDWLQNFAFSIHLNAMDFVLPLVAIFGVVIATISYNCLKSSIINPSRSLQQT
jgi:putative ABC transport system permease protein